MSYVAVLYVYTVSLFMRFRVVVTHHRGVPRPKREIAAADGTIGELLTTDRSDELLRRTTVVATLIDPRGGAQTELLPSLHDACLVLMAPGGMMLRGSERLSTTDDQTVEFVQGWWARPVEQPPRTDSDSHGSVPHWTKRLK